MVIAIPALLFIERDQKQIGTIQLLQVSLTAWFFDYCIAQRRGQLIQDGGLIHK